MPGPTSKDPRKREPAWVKIPLDSEAVFRSTTRDERREKQRKLEELKRAEEARRKEEEEAAKMLAAMWEQQDKEGKSKRPKSSGGDNGTPKSHQEPLDLSRKNEDKGGRWETVEEKKEATWRPSDGVSALLERAKASRFDNVQTRPLKVEKDKLNDKLIDKPISREEMVTHASTSIRGDSSSGTRVRRFREKDDESDDDGGRWHTLDEPSSRESRGKESSNATGRESSFAPKPPETRLSFAKTARIPNTTFAKGSAFQTSQADDKSDEEDDKSAGVKRVANTTFGRGSARKAAPPSAGAKRKEMAKAFGMTAFGLDDDEDEEQASVRREIRAMNKRQRGADLPESEAMLSSAHSKYANMTKEQVFMELAKFKKACAGKSMKLPEDLKARVAEVCGASNSMMYI